MKRSEMRNIEVTNEMLDALRERVKPYMKEKRYLHTLGVERECAAIGELLLPDKVNKLRAAALLHDITKMLSLEKQLKLCRTFGIIYGTNDLSSPKLFHAKTAAALIGRDFPEFADDEIISAVRWHTTGRRDMSVFEGIVYLSDYIEETREFDECVELRRYFWDSVAEKKLALAQIYCMTMIKSFDLTLNNLIEEKAPIDFDTVDARNFFIETYREIYYEI